MPDGVPLIQATDAKGTGLSEEQLVDAYANGRITRRVFVRHLVAAGVSISTALFYARALEPAAAMGAQGQGPRAHHGKVHHKAKT